MIALALDSSTELLGVAVDTGTSRAEISIDAGLRHGQRLLSVAEQLAQEVEVTLAAIETCICTIGPGSFTGVRIGVATALGIGAARSCNVIGVPSLDAYAWRHRGDQTTLAVIDARKSRFYCGLYRFGERLGPLLDLGLPELVEKSIEAFAESSVDDDSERIVITGPGADAVVDGFRDHDVAVVRDDGYRRAAAGEALDIGLSDLARGNPRPPMPIYLRKSEAEIGAVRSESGDRHGPVDRS